jgi:hypothetical protein
MEQFTDAHALLDRAKTHYQDFQKLWHRERPDAMWSISEERGNDGKFTYRLNFNRQLVTQMRPIMADTANNIVAALDHLISACARINGHGRDVRTSFPWLFEDESFRKALGKVATLTGERVASVIEDVWFNNGFERPHLQAVKELSNSGKHWELMHSASGAHAVQIGADASRQMFQIPADAFENSDVFEFGNSENSIIGVPCLTVLSLSVRGLSDGLPNSSDSIFECSQRFAERIIGEVQARGF